MCQGVSMTAKTTKLFEDYKAEYLRVNGRTPQLNQSGTWVEIIGRDDAPGNKYRISEIPQMIERFKRRPNFIPA